jgi:hypothetical protein
MKFISYIDENGEKKLRLSDESLNEINERKVRKEKEKIEKKIKNKEIEKRQEEYIIKFIKENPNCDGVLVRRFFSKVDIKNENECWNWLNLINSGGYGQFKYDSKTIGAHRISYILSNGKILEGMNILHRCDNKRCVNSKHLFLGTHQDNSDDMFNKGRDRCSHNQNGEDNPNTNLTWELVNKIRKEYFENDISMDMLGKKYGITHSTIGFIIDNKTWHDENYKPFLMRNIKCEKSAWSKLTWKKVDEIRQKYKTEKTVMRNLAKEYNMSSGTICQILNNEIWYDENYKGWRIEKQKVEIGQ